MKHEIEEVLEKFGIGTDDIKLILASAGAFYNIRKTTQKFEENNGNNYEDQEFTNELFNSLYNVCNALGHNVYDYIE